MAESSKRRFVWGWGRLPQHCKLHRTVASVPKPKLLDALESSSLSQLLVANGIVAVAHSGDMYAWGAPGQVPPQISPSPCSACLELQQLAPPPFARVQSIDNEVVSHATYTAQQYVAVTESGSVYRWSFDREVSPPVASTLEPLSVATSSSYLAPLTPISARSSSTSLRKSVSEMSVQEQNDSMSSSCSSCSSSSDFCSSSSDSSSSSDLPVSSDSSLSLASPRSDPVSHSRSASSGRKFKSPPPPPPLPFPSVLPPPPPPPSPPAPPSPTSCGMTSPASSSSLSLLPSGLDSALSTTSFPSLPSSSSYLEASPPPSVSSPSMATVLSRLDSSIDASKASLCLQTRASGVAEYKCGQAVLVEGVPPAQQVVGSSKDIWLLGKDGQLYHSHNNLAIVSIPTSLVTGDKVVSIACGFSHALAITAQGAVLSWGQGEGGRLGHGDELPRTEPTKIGRLDYAQIVEVACGYHHSLARSSAGRVHVWGGNQFGQLGCGDKVHKLTPVKLDQLPNPEQDVQNKVISLSAGAFHTGFVTSRGELLTCGWGEYGQLGLGDENNRVTPTVVGALRGMDVSMIACAGRFTVCVTEYFIKINVNHFASDTDSSPATFVSPPFISNSDPAPTPTASSSQQLSPSKVSIHLTSKPTSPLSTNAATQHDLLFKLIRGLVPPADEAPLRLHLPTTTTHPSADFSLPPFVDVQKPSDSAIAQSYRPPYFPAKSAEEAKKHALEAERMNARYQKKLEIRDKESITKNFFSAEASATSRARQEKDNKKKLAREKAMDVHTKEWIKKVLPNWGTQKTLEKAQKLSLKLGIPPSIRPKIWPQLVGNVLQIDENSYRVVTQNAANARARWEKERSDVPEGKESTFMDIDVDLARTFPQLTFFKSHGAHHVQLQTILDTYCFYRPELGYVQGMSYLAGILLLYMPPFEAFVCFANLLHRPYADAFSKLNIEKMNARCKLHQSLLREYHPDLADWLEGQGLQPEMYLMDWFIALFCKSLPLELVGRVWDGYLLFGESFVYRTSTAICAVLKPRLLNSPLDVCLKVLKSESQNLDEDLLFENIAKIKLSEKDIAKLEASERAQAKAELPKAVSSIHIANKEMDDFVSGPRATDSSLSLSGARRPSLYQDSLASLHQYNNNNYTSIHENKDNIVSSSSSSSSSATPSSSSSSSTSASSSYQRRLSLTQKREEDEEEESGQSAYTEVLLKELEAKKAELVQHQQFMTQRVGALKAALASSIESESSESQVPIKDTAASVQYLEALSDGVIARLDLRDGSSVSTLSSTRSSSLSPRHADYNASFPRSFSFSTNSSASSLSKDARTQSFRAPYVPALARSDIPYVPALVRNEDTPYVPALARDDRPIVSPSSSLASVESARNALSSTSDEPWSVRAQESAFLREGSRLGREGTRQSRLQPHAGFSEESPRMPSSVGSGHFRSADEQLQHDLDQAQMLRLKLQYEELQRKIEKDSSVMPPLAYAPFPSQSHEMFSPSSSSRTEPLEPVTISALAAKISSILKPT